MIFPLSKFNESFRFRNRISREFEKDWIVVYPGDNYLCENHVNRDESSYVARETGEESEKAITESARKLWHNNYTHRSRLLRVLVIGRDAK